MAVLRYWLYDLLFIAHCVQSYTWKNLPGLLFGMLSLLAGILSLCLPETKKVRLTQTIDEGEKFAANMVITDYWSVASLLVRISYSVNVNKQSVLSDFVARSEACTCHPATGLERRIPDDVVSAVCTVTVILPSSTQNISFSRISF